MFGSEIRLWETRRDRWWLEFHPVMKSLPTSWECDDTPLCDKFWQ
jgi:hypothetical protein